MRLALFISRRFLMLCFFRFTNFCMPPAIYLSFFLALTHANLTFAQSNSSYPNKPIQVVAPSTAGGGFDLVARVLGVKLSEQMGQQFVVENKPGSGTLIGTQTIAKAAPDGYHILVGGLSNIALNMGLYKQPGYDPINDFVPLRLVVSHSYTLIGTKSLPANNLKDLFAYAKANPGKLNYGTATGAAILATAQLAQLAKLKMVQIPYKGDAPLLTDALAGRVHLMFASGAAVIPHVRSGKLRALATLLPNRSPLLPEVPTIVEAGVKLSITPWAGLFGPRGLPPEVVNGLNLGVGKVLARADVREQLGALAFDPQSSTPDEFRSFVKDQLGAWRSVAVEAGIQPE